MRRVAISTGVALVLGVALALIGGPAWDVVRWFGLGWLSYPLRIVPQIRIAWDGVVTGLVCLALFSVGLHWTLIWLYGELQRSSGARAEGQRRWSLRWTASAVVLIVLMFVVGIAAAGVVHQVGWLIASRRSLVEPRIAVRDIWGQSSVNHLKYIGMGSGMLFTDSEPLAAGEHRPNGEVRQSWMTELLPGTFYVIGGPLRPDRPWNDPANSAYFRGVVPIFLNPEVQAIRSAEGYALSHYAGNVQVLGRDRASRGLAAAEAANTILAGEVAEGFRPWGDPANLRDPGLGVNKVSGGFGGPSGSGANFLFGDGSVRFYKESTSRAVLRRSSLPGATDPRPLEGKTRPEATVRGN